MIKVEQVSVWGFEHAIRGMRNPKNSWADSDSVGETVGKNDLILMKKLYKGGNDHRKYARQIMVSMDIMAPLYWWKQMDTYKVGTVSNSCSTMHKLTGRALTMDDFSFEMSKKYAPDLIGDILDALNEGIDIHSNFEKYKGDKLLSDEIDKKEVFQFLTEILPSAYNQKRTVTMNYENVFAILHQRKGHKLQEWKDFIEVLKDLPYVREITQE